MATQDTSAGLVVRNHSSRLGSGQSSVNVPEKLQLFEQGLVGRDVNQNRRSFPLFSQYDRASRILHLSEQTLRCGLKVGGRMDVFSQVQGVLRHRDSIAEDHPRRTVPSINPYGSVVATKISLRFSRPKGVRSTGR